jgi:glycosyltransferase involved in cell wall biosynthesis
MRILFCNYEYPPLGGGGGVVTSFIAEELAKRHEVTVLTSRALGLPSEQVENGVRIIRVPVYFRRQGAVANLASMLTYIPMAIRVGIKHIMTERYDLINSHFVLPTGPVGLKLARFGRIPHVLTLHGGDLYDPTKFTSPHRHLFIRKTIKWLLKNSNLVVVNSRNTLNNMQQYFTAEIEGKLTPLGIRRQHDCNPAFRGNYRCSDSEVLLVTVGRLIARKAVSQLISVMNMFKDKNARLLVIGKGPLEQNLKNECKDKRLMNKTIFLGFVEESEKYRILRMCDIYVSTSQHEGFGLVFLEAMHSGLPIVCYDHGGHTEFVQNNETGYIVPLNDLNLFKERCEFLIDNQDLRRSIGENNKRRVREFYIDKSASMYEEAFTSIL